MKHLKQIILIILSFMLTSSFGFAGDTDGGGGGTLPPNPISKRTALYTISKSKPELRLVTRSLESLRKRGVYFDQKLERILNELNLKGSMIELVENTGIEVMMTGPCYDLHGNEKDGSVVASKPGFICMSAHRMAPKLIQERSRKEIVALIIHEYAHILGANEDDATYLQRWVANDGLSNSTDDTTEEKIEYAESLLKQMSDQFVTLARRASFYPKYPIYDLVASEIPQPREAFFRDVFYNGLLPFLTVITEDEMDEFRLNMARFAVIQNFEVFKDNGDKIFKGESKITYKEWMLRTHGQVYPNKYADEYIHKIDGGPQIEFVASNIAKYLKEFHMKIQFDVHRNYREVSKTNSLVILK